MCMYISISACVYIYIYVIFLTERKGYLLTVVVFSKYYIKPFVFYWCNPLNPFLLPWLRCKPWSQRKEYNFKSVYNIVNTKFCGSGRLINSSLLIKERNFRYEVLFRGIEEMVPRVGWGARAPSELFWTLALEAVTIILSDAVGTSHCTSHPCFTWSPLERAGLPLKSDLNVSSLSLLEISSIVN